ncbi:cadherin-like domain-containing protein [Aquabacter cavernae]|uniref:cadherin-like domain-containing protein n=1 Tax=Aquabacter cavernae TaxID=2496029 RepID=UPI000F8F699F|nr:cadherin-like domain-containing protein [Aquabacter cavernae]
MLVRTTSVAPAVSFTENAGAVFIAPIATLTDDSGTLASLTVTIASAPNGAAETLSIAGTLPAGITASYNPTTHTLTLSGDASAADYQAALRLVAYANSSDSPNTDPRTISVVVTDADGAASTPVSLTVSVANVNDAPTGAVSLTGTLRENFVLTAGHTVTDADGMPSSPTYQWQRLDGSTWTDISGATAATYTLTDDDVGHRVRAVLRYTDGQGTAETIISASTSAVAAANSTPAGTVSITGTAEEDSVLTAASTVADADGMPTAATYQWQRLDGSTWVNISGATAATYTLSQTDVGHQVRAVLSFTDGQGTAETVTSAATTAIANVNDAPTGTVTVSGTTTQGAVLAATNTVADADGMPTATAYQWQRLDGSTWVDISGATGATYSLTQADVGHLVRAQLRYTDSQSTAEAVTSAATSAIANVNDVPTGTPVATPLAGMEDTALTLTAADLLTGFSDADGDTLSITGLTTSAGTLTDNGNGTWTLTPAANFSGTVTLTYSVADGQGGTLAGQTRAVAFAAVNDAPTGTPVAAPLSGTEDTALTLTAADLLTGFSDADGDTLSVTGLTASGGTLVANSGGTWTLTPAANFFGTVTLTYTVSDGQGGTLAGQTRTVTFAPVNDAPTGLLTVTGTTAQGAVLTVSDLVDDTDGRSAASTYQWQRLDGATWVDIGDATGTTYTLTQADVGHQVRVHLRYTDAQGAAETVAGTATSAIANVNDGPIGTPVAAPLSGTEDTAFTLTAADLLTGFSDADGDTLSVTGLTASGGTLVANSNGTWTLTPTPNFFGTVTLTYSVADGQGGTLAGQTRTVTFAPVNDAPTGTVTVGGTAEQGAVLTAANTVADADGLPASPAYQWQRFDGTSWVDIGGATGTTYALTQADVGHEVRVQLRYTDAQGAAEVVTSTGTAPIANVNDAPTGTLSVTGTAREGAMLTAASTVADADGLPASLTYQWQRFDGTAWVDIGGATGTTYTLVQADVGHEVRAQLSYMDNQGTAEVVTGTSSAVVAPLNTAPTGTVSVAGTAEQGAVLTASDTVADADGLPASLTYQWQRLDGATWVDIGGATGTTYTLTQDDVGHEVRAQLRYTDNLGAAEVVTSAATSAIANVNDAPTGAVTVTGTAEEGAVLTAASTVADADGLSAAPTYQWQRLDGGAWVDISGATGATYALTQSDVGHEVRAQLRYTDDLGSVESVSSATTGAIANVNDLPTGTVSVAGVAEQGAVLTATSTVADADGLPASPAYQWQRLDGGTWVDITGATGTTYTLTQAEVGHQVRAELRYTDGQGTAETVTSSAISPVSNVNDAPTGGVAVTGTAVRDGVLTLANTITDADGLTGSFAYQWQRFDGVAWVDIGGATGATYALTQADVGHQVRAQISYTDGLGTAETVTSAATASVAHLNTAPTGTVSVTGAATAGALLTATNTVADEDGLPSSPVYQWQRQVGGTWVDIAGAIGATYSLTQADIGHQVRAALRYTDAMGAAEAVASAPTGAVAPLPGPNGMPAAQSDSFAFAAGEAVTIDVLANDSDPEGDTLRITAIDGHAITAGSAVAVDGGAVALATDGTLRFTPGAGTTGSVTFSYTVADPAGGTATAMVTSSAVLADLLPRFEEALGNIGLTVSEPGVLLPVLSVIFPGVLGGAGGASGPGGYVLPAGFDFDPDSLSGDTGGLLNAMLMIAQGLNADAPAFMTADGSGGWTSATLQSLAIQSLSGADPDITVGTGDEATGFSGGMTQDLAWTRAFAQMVLRPDFDPASVIAYDRNAQAAAHQSDVGAGARLDVKIDGTQALSPHADLSSPFGLADFLTEDGGSAVGVARLVTTAHTLGGADDQQAIIRMRQNGMQDVEVMFYAVDDYTGMVDGLRPGDAGYDAASRSHAYQTDSGAVWIAGAGYGQYGEARLSGVDDGDLIAMRLSAGGHDFYMFATANETVNGESVNHVWNYGLNTWGWEDLHGGGDRDFNDLVVQMDFVSAALADQVL